MEEKRDRGLSSPSAGHEEHAPEVNLRRRFLNLLLGVSGLALVGGIIYPIFRYLMPPKNPGSMTGKVEVGPESEFRPGSGTIFRFGDKPGILIRGPDGSLAAYSAVCTHLGCTVGYRPDHKDIYCACHGGVYNLNGKNIAGPPPKPLEKYHVKVENGKVYVSKNETGA